MKKMMNWTALVAVTALCACSALAQPLDGFTINGGTLQENQAGQFPIYFQDVSGTPIDTGTRFIGAINLEFTVNGSLIQAASFERAGLLQNASVLIEIEEIELAQNKLRWSILFTSPPLFNLDQMSPGDLIGNLNITAAAGTGGQTIVLTPVNDGVFITEEVGSPTLYLSRGELFGTFGDIMIQGGTSNPPPAINSFSVTPGSIQSGQSATLSWSVSNADSVTINPGIGTVASSGSRVLSPTSTVNYTLQATNAFGTASRSLTLTVNDTPDPIVINSFIANPTSINAGDSSTLSWDVVNADNIRIEQGNTLVVNSTAGTGNTRVFPSQTASYTLTASANGRTTQTRTVRVSVNASSEVTINAFTVDKPAINFQETATLSWLISGANSIRLSETDLSGVTRDLGPQSANGERIVQPLVDTRYTITGIGSDGSASKTLTVTVAANDVLKVSPEQLAMSSGDTSREVELSNVINRPLFWSLISSPDWISVSETSGTVTTSVQKVVVTPRREMLISGVNRGELVFKSGEQEIKLLITVESDGQQNTVLVYPFLRADGINNTTYSLVNLESEEINYRLDLFNQDGSQIGQTENGTLPRLGSKRWTFGGSTNGQGWARILIPGLADAQLSGVINIRSVDGEELSAYSPEKLSQGNVFVPHIARDPAFFTQGALVNVAQVGENYGFNAGNRSYELGDLAANQQSIFNFRSDLLEGTIPQDGWGDLRAQDTMTAMTAVELFGRSTAESRQTVAVGLDSKTSQTLIFPHIAADVSQFWTGLIIINPNDVPMTVNYQAYDSNGELVEGKAPETYAPGQKRAFLVDSSVQSFGEGATWLTASSSDGPLLGYMLYGSFPEIADRFAGFQSVKTTQTKMCFPHIEQATVPGSYTGLAVVNTSNSNNNVQFRLVDQNGQTKAQEFVLLQPKQKYVNLTDTLFSEYLQNDSFQKDDKIVVLGTQSLAGFEVFGNGRKTMGSILAVGYE